MRQAVPVNMHLGAFARLAAVVSGLVVATTALVGCAEAESMVPLAPVTNPSARVQTEAETQADRLGRMLQAIEERYALEPDSVVRAVTDLPPTAPTFLAASTTVIDAPEQLSASFNLASQPRAFIQAQASYLEDSAGTSGRPVAVTVEATDVTVVGTDADGAPVAQVMIETTYHYAVGPSSVSSVGYAVSWAPGSNVDASGKAVKGVHFDGMRLSSIRPLYGQLDSPALDSGLGTKSPTNAVHSYIRAITHGSAANVSSMEGTVRSSDDFRAVLKERLLAGQIYTVVELPAARMGTAHVLYVIQDDVPGALRLDVILGPDGTTVVPRL